MSNNVQPEITDSEDHRPSTASSSTRTTRSQTRRSSLPNPFTTSTNTSKKRTRDQIDGQEEPEQSQASSNNTRSSTLPKTTATSSKPCDAPEPPATKRSRRSLPNLTPASKPSPSTADRKGKKRTLPSSPSPPPLPQQPAAGSSSLSTITPDQGKKTVKSKNSYALRSATATIPSINTATSSPKGKAKAATSNKGKAKQPATMAKKAKSISKQKSGGERMAKGNSGPGGSGSSRRQRHYDDMDDMDSDMEDVAMLGSSDEEVDIERDAAAVDDKNTSSGTAPAASSSSNSRAAVPPASSGGGVGGMGSGAAAAALFGSDFRSLGGYMIGLSSRLKSILTHIRSTNPTIQLSALQEASEVLSVSTEDTLAGYFQVDAFVKEFVAIMAGKPTSPAEPEPAKSSSGRTGAVSGSGPSRSIANCNEDDVNDDDHGDGDDLHHHEDDESGEEHDDDDDDGEEGRGESGSDEGEGEGDHDEDDDPFGHSGGGGEILDEYEDEDVALARALAMSTQDAFGGGGGGGDMIMMGEDPSADKLEAQLLACRCLANLMEALPGSAHTVVHHGAVPVLCSKLVEIQYIDLAEQTLSTMEKISQEYPSAIVREGGLGALLNFLDFFSTNVQRTAVTAAANCCRNISTEHFDKVREVFPMLRNVLSYPDQRLVEQGALAVVRTLDAYRYKAEHLEVLLDIDLVRALNTLLLPAGGSPALSTVTYTHLLRAMTAGAKSSPKVTLVFLEAGMVDTLYQIFTGVQPGTHDADEQGNSAEGQGLGGGLADMLVLHNLAHRPKEHIEEALALLSELLPPLPRDGVFDSKGYTEKALSRLARAKVKASRATSRQPSSTSLSTAGQEAVASSFSADASEAPNAAATVDGEQAEPSSSMSIVAADDPATIAHKDRAKEVDQATEIRLEALRSKPELVSRFLKMLLPVLVDVYAASVALRVRTKVLTGLLKTISFLPSEDLPSFLENVPLPSFLGSILSSREFPTLVSAALQLVELLTIKLPAVYKTSFRREGVMYEVDLLAEQELSTAKATKKAEAAAASAIPASKAAEPSPSAGAAANPPATTTDSEAAPASGLSIVPVGLSTPARSTSAAAASFALLTSSPAAASNPSSSVKRSSSVPLDPQDANILRARVMRTKTVADAAGDSTGDDDAAQTLDRMRGFVAQLTDKEASVKTLENVMTQLAVLFAPGAESVSSFELLQSGLVDGLLEYTIIDGKTSSAVRRRLLFQILSMESADGAKSPLAMLIKRLQESLSRMESFEVLTAFYGLPGDDSKRNSASLLARQLRLKLVAEEGSDVPKSSSALVVSIQAIATFQALNDYLRPRIAAPPTSLGGSSRLSDGPGMGPSSSASSALRAALSAASGLDLGDPQSLSSKVDEGEPSSSTDTKAETNHPSSSSAKADDAGAAKLERRRSARLNKAENGKDAVEASGVALADEGGAGEGLAIGEAGGSSSAEITAAAGGAGSSAAAREAASKLSAALDALLPAGMEGLEYDEYDDEEGMYSDEYDDEMFDGGLEDEIPRPAEKTVDLAVAADGSKVEVKTPDGTRISTPPQPTVSAGGASTTALGDEDPSPSGSMLPGAPARSSSYAGALKSKPTDWHLQFSMNGKVLPLDTTVFGAIHRAESSAGVTNGLQRGVWSGVYTVNFKKVSGAAPALAKERSPEPSTRDPSSATAVPDSVPQDSPQAKILRLLRVFHALNAEAGDSTFALRPATLPESAFVNNKLTAKLGRQLEEPMIIASKCLPDWAQELPRFFPFLFPFETRFAFLESTSFGYSRLIQKWASQQAKSSSSDSRRNDDSLSFLSRLQRQKVRISRSHLLESALKVFELYGTGSAILEVEYFDEVGTGLGPTLEFYSLVSQEFARRDLKLWRDADSSTPGDYVHRPQGLFPRPISDVEASGPSGVQYDKVYRVLGQFVAKALIDSRIIDMSFNPVFLKLVQGHPPPLTIDSLRSVDVRLAKSLARVADYAEAKKVILADQALSEEDKASQIEDVVINHVRLIDLCLDFTLPGYDIELKTGGANLAVDMTNVEEYLAMVVEYTLIKGTASAVAAFRAGFSTIFPVRDLLAFSADELVILFGSAEEDWSIDTLNNAMKADHGYNIESRSISHLIEVMSTYDAPERREFLQFITGAPRLPTGGFKSLHPPLTVVRKGHEPPLKPDDYLPSVMTCVNYLKLPDYSSREVLASKLSTAMREGGGAFHLS